MQLRVVVLDCGYKAGASPTEESSARAAFLVSPVAHEKIKYRMLVRFSVVPLWNVFGMAIVW